MTKDMQHLEIEMVGKRERENVDVAGDLAPRGLREACWSRKFEPGRRFPERDMKIELPLMLEMVEIIARRGDAMQRRGEASFPIYAQARCRIAAGRQDFSDGANFGGCHEKIEIGLVAIGRIFAEVRNE